MSDMENLRTVDVEIHDAWGIGTARSQGKGEHFVGPVTHREAASTFRTIVAGSPNGAKPRRLRFAGPRRNRAFPESVIARCRRECIGQAIAPFDLGVRRDDLETGFELVERSGDDLVLQLGLVA